MLFDIAEASRREIAPGIRGAIRSDAKKEQSGTTTDFEDMLRSKGQDANDSCINPLLHLFCQQWMARIGAIPAHDVKCGLRIFCRFSIGLVKNLLPLLHLFFRKLCIASFLS